MSFRCFLSRKSPRHLPFRIAGVLTLFSVAVFADDHAIASTAHIDLTYVGYRQPSRIERLTDEASVSLDFVDATHLLLTFNPRKLLKRVHGCRPTHDDRMIHAVVLESPSGKMISEANCYRHDQRRYLWPPVLANSCFAS